MNNKEHHNWTCWYIPGIFGNIHPSTSFGGREIIFSATHSPFWNDKFINGHHWAVKMWKWFDLIRCRKAIRLPQICLPSQDDKRRWHLIKHNQHNPSQRQDRARISTQVEFFLLLLNQYFVSIRASSSPKHAGFVRTCLEWKINKLCSFTLSVVDTSHRSSKRTFSCRRCFAVFIPYSRALIYTYARAKNIAWNSMLPNFGEN